MSDTSALTHTERRTPERRQKFKNAAIVLWGIAFLCTILRTYDAANVRILALTGGLLVIDVGLALLLTLLAYLEATRTEGHVVAGYLYNCGWRDHAAETDTHPGLRLVDPAREFGERADQAAPRRAGRAR